MAATDYARVERSCFDSRGLRLGADTCIAKVVLGRACIQKAKLNMVMARYFLAGFCMERGCHGHGWKQGFETIYTAMDEVGGHFAEVYGPREWWKLEYCGS